jgi:predicted kinase
MSDKVKLVLMVGPPASGKSTFGKKYAQDNNLEYVSSDAIRAEIGTGESDLSVSGAAFKLAKQRVEAALVSGKGAVMDATNINHKSRSKWLSLGKKYNVEVTAFAFEINRDKLLKRDAERERHVGTEVIDMFIEKYVRPTKQEVDEVILIQEK